MKRALLLLCLPPLVHAQQLIAPVPAPISVTIRMCAPDDESEDCRNRRAEWSRLKDEQDMNAAILDDFRDAQAHKVTPATRSRIISLARRLAKNSYF